MAGVWNLSHHRMADLNGRAHDGALATFYAADTLNKIPVFADYGLGTPLPNPVQANAYGIFPPVFFDEAVGFYRQRITTKGGVLIPGTDVGTLPIIGPGEGGGGSEVPVDPNALLQTGDPLWVPRSGTRAGFVRANARTIGSSTSGASERANADTEALYLYLWATYSDTICPVTGGRGVSAAADWAGNKPTGLLDLRGRSNFGLDDMGNTAASAFTGVPFTVGNATSAASSGGLNRHVLTLSEGFPHDHGGSTGAGTPHRHGFATEFTDTQYGGGVENSLLRAGSTGSARHTDYESAHTHPIASAGGGTAHNNAPLLMLGTWYLKL